MTEITALAETVPFDIQSPGNGMTFAVLHWIGAAGQRVPPWWSTSRDIWLRQFYLRSDYLKIAVKTFVEKATGVPLLISARDHSVKAHVALAEQMQDNLQRNSGILKGFGVEFAKFAKSYCTQDNGAFFLVMGAGEPTGPIAGPAMGVYYLDSKRCMRTGDPEFPVLYYHKDGKRYALHYTRVIMLSCMPSDDDDMLDVGVCPISACIDAAQDMLDISVYNAEKLGSRPPRQLLYAKTGATLKQLTEATQMANIRMDGQGLDRFARTMLLAPATSTGQLELEQIDLASVPDGFDRLQATSLDVAVIASAFGLDARDLAHSFGMAGQTKADAEIMDVKTKGKGVSGMLKDLAEQISAKFLPETLVAEFDYVDDGQDEYAANIRKTRAEGRQIDLTIETITVRVAREQMLSDEEITDEQFEDLELADGRLPDGLDVLMLFQSKDAEISAILEGITDNPLSGGADDALIDERILLAWQRHDAAPNANIKRKMRQAIAALEKLREGSKPATPELAMNGQPPIADEQQPAMMQPVTNEQPPVNGQPPTNGTAPNGPPSLGAATKEAITPRGAGASLPAVPSEDDIAADAEENADEALQSWDEALPAFAGLLDASVTGKKKELKQSDRFSYDEVSFRYRDNKTGRFISEDTLQTLTQQYEAAQREVGPALAERLANKEITARQWVEQMRSELRNTYSAEYMAGRGGRNAMTQADWGRVGNMLRNQYQYLDKFGDDIAAGKLSQAQIAARSQQYFNSATQAYERGKVGARGMPDLPAYPGDGGTPCGSNCKCSWSISETKSAWKCTWKLSSSEHCSGCVERAEKWAPLVVSKE